MRNCSTLLLKTSAHQNIILEKQKKGNLSIENICS